MRIIQEKMVCPCCKKEITNELLASYNSEMVEDANFFNSINIIENNCDECKLPLVKLNFLKYYNEKGKIEIKTHYEKIDGVLLKEQYEKILLEIYNLNQLINDDTIKITSVVEVIEDKLISKLNLCLSKLESESPLFCLTTNEIKLDSRLKNQTSDENYYKNFFSEINNSYFNFFKKQLFKDLGLQIIEVFE